MRIRSARPLQPAAAAAVMGSARKRLKEGELGADRNVQMSDSDWREHWKAENEKLNAALPIDVPRLLQRLLTYDESGNSYIALIDHNHNAPLLRPLRCYPYISGDMNRDDKYVYDICCNEIFIQEVDNPYMPNDDFITYGSEINTTVNSWVFCDGELNMENMENRAPLLGSHMLDIPMSFGQYQLQLFKVSEHTWYNYSSSNNVTNVTMRIRFANQYTFRYRNHLNFLTDYRSIVMLDRRNKFAQPHQFKGSIVNIIAIMPMAHVIRSREDCFLESAPFRVAFRKVQRTCVLNDICSDYQMDATEEGAHFTEYLHRRHWHRSHNGEPYQGHCERERHKRFFLQERRRLIVRFHGVYCGWHVAALPDLRLLNLLESALTPYINQNGVFGQLEILCLEYADVDDDNDQGPASSSSSTSTPSSFSTLTSSSSPSTSVASSSTTSPPSSSAPSSTLPANDLPGSPSTISSTVANSANASSLVFVVKALPFHTPTTSDKTSTAFMGKGKSLAANDTSTIAPSSTLASTTAASSLSGNSKTTTSEGSNDVELPNVTLTASFLLLTAKYHPLNADRVHQLLNDFFDSIDQFQHKDDAEAELLVLEGPEEEQPSAKAEVVSFEPVVEPSPDMEFVASDFQSPACPISAALLTPIPDFCIIFIVLIFVESF